MTRAALLALRTAGTLRTECHYIITDGPVIGTTGNTSATEIEMHAVSATELAIEAKVHTTFAASAWDALYDIDAGTSGTIFRLTDDWNNFAEDEDPNSPTVHTQVPWHKGSATFSGNRFDTVIMPGWSAAGGTLNDNTLKGCTVDLTGVTSGQFRRNAVSDGSVWTISTPAVTVVQNTATNAVVNCQGSGALSVQDNAMTSGSLTVDAASTVAVTFDNNVVGGTSGGYRVLVQGKTGSAVTVSGNRLFGKSLDATRDLLCAGTGSIVVTDNSVNATIVQLNGSGTSAVQGNTLTGGIFDKVSGSSGGLNVQQSQCNASNLTIGAANASANDVTRCSVRGGTFTLNGPLAGGNNAFDGSSLEALSVTVAATATAGVWLDGGTYRKGSITQNRTAGTGALKLIDCTTLGAGSSVTDNGTVNPAGFTVELQRVSLTDTAVNIGNLDAARSLAPLLAYVDALHSTVNLTGLPSGFVGDGRMLFSTLTNAGFELHTFTMDGATKTLTASTSGKAASVAFDNF
jgi:hypothetical protein